MIRTFFFAAAPLFTPQLVAAGTPAQALAPQICVLGGSHGEHISIHLDGKRVFDGVLAVNPDSSPQVGCFNAPAAKRKQSILTVAGGQFKSKQEIDWGKGVRIILGLGDNGNTRNHFIE